MSHSGTLSHLDTLSDWGRLFEDGVSVIYGKKKLIDESRVNLKEISDETEQLISLFPLSIVRLSSGSFWFFLFLELELFPLPPFLYEPCKLFGNSKEPRTGLGTGAVPASGILIRLLNDPLPET